MRLSRIIPLIALPTAWANYHRIKGKRRVQDFGRKLAYNYYTLDNKFKLADNDTGGGGRDRDENLHDDPNPPIAYSNNSPTSPLAAPPTAYTTRSPSLTDAQSEGEAMEFEIDVNNPGFVTENGFLTPFDGDQEVPLHEKPEELEGNLPGFPQVNFGPIFEGVSTKKLKGTSKGFRNAVIDSFSLGHRRLYGMTSGPDSSIYISELLYGGIIKLNISSGEMEHAVSSFDFFERPSGGLAYYKDYLVVAGLGPTYDVEPCLHVYNVKNGDAIISCQPNFPTGQIMDVTVVENTAYATDSTVNQIVSMNMDDASEGKCNMTSIKLPNSFLSDEEEPIDLATGIIGYKGGIIISNYQVGGLYFHEFKTKQTTQLVDRWELPHPTGIALWDDRLLFVANGDNLITLFKLKDKARGVKAVKKGAITAPDFDGPRSPVVLGNNLFAVNSKIESLGFPRQGESDPEDFEVDFELIAILF